MLRNVSHISIFLSLNILSHCDKARLFFKVTKTLKKLTDNSYKVLLVVKLVVILNFAGVQHLSKLMQLLFLLSFIQDYVMIIVVLLQPKHSF